MNVLTIILGVIVIIMSLVLLFVMPIAGVIGLIVGGAVIYMSIRKIKEAKKSKEEPIALSPIRSAPKEIPANIPSRQYDKTATVRIAGVTFKCQMDHEESRQEILSLMQENDPVEIEPFDFRDRPGYLVINPAVGLDVGMLPKEIAEAYPDREIEGYITEVDTFFPEDKEDEIWFGKVKIFILKEALDA